MYPGFIYWRKRAGRGSYCGNDWSAVLAHACHSSTDAADSYRAELSPGASFGVRRPLRFLAHKLELNEKQVAELARVLNELKTERAQAEVDRRRTVSALADAVAGDTFDNAKAGEGAKLRVSSAERLRDAVVKALQQIHAMLDGEQRGKLAYLIRTGTLLI